MNLRRTLYISSPYTVNTFSFQNQSFIIGSSNNEATKNIFGIMYTFWRYQLFQWIIVNNKMNVKIENFVEKC